MSKPGGDRIHQVGARQYLVDTLEFSYGPILVALAYAALISSDPSAEIILAITINTAESLREIGNGFDLEDTRNVSRGAFGLATFLAFPFAIAALLRKPCFKSRDDALNRPKTKLHDIIDASILLLVQAGVLAVGAWVAIAILISPEIGPVWSWEGVLLGAAAGICAIVIFVTWLLSDLKFELTTTSPEPWTRSRARPVGSAPDREPKSPASVNPVLAPKSLSIDPIEAASGEAPNPGYFGTSGYVPPTRPKSGSVVGSEDVLGALKPYWPLIQQFGIILVAPVVLVLWAFLQGFGSFLLSAIGFTTLFLLFLAALLAFLTSISARMAPNSVPLFFGLVLLIVLAGSSGGLFWGIAGGVLVVLIVVHKRNGPLPVAWKIIAALVLLFGIGKIVVPECRSLSGCNLIKGEVIAERPWLDRTDPEASDSVAHAFSLWVDDDSSTPVRLVAAQGGGLYAAYYTAYYLAARADTEGQPFIDSLFAISGVSGGSVGAAVFWSVVRSGACSPAPGSFAPSNCHVDAVDEILRQDYLSPQFLRLFTLDAIDAVIPISAVWPEPIDRGRRLETVLADRVTRCCFSTDATADPSAQTRVRHLDTPISGSWAPDAGVPMLFLNATDVHTGTRAIASPMAISYAGGVATRLELNGNRDLSVAGAAVMSARFPFISPAGRIQNGGETRQLVDGGYFDNSGLVTLHDVLRAIRPHVGDRPVEVIALTIDGNPCMSGDGNSQIGCAERAPKGLLGTPLTTMLSIRNGQEELSMDRFCQSWSDAQDIDLEISEVAIEPREFNFTLSWFLSSRTFDDIAAQANASLSAQRDLCSEKRLER